MNTDAAKMKQYQREAEEMRQAAEAAQFAGEMEYIIRAATEANAAR